MLFALGGVQGRQTSAEPPSALRATTVKTFPSLATNEISTADVGTRHKHFDARPGQSVPVGLDRLGRDPSGLRPAILAPFPSHPGGAPGQSRPTGHQVAAPAMRAPNAYGVIPFECWKPQRVH